MPSMKGRDLSTLASLLKWLKRDIVHHGWCTLSVMSAVAAQLDANSPKFVLIKHKDEFLVAHSADDNRIGSYRGSTYK